MSKRLLNTFIIILTLSGLTLSGPVQARIKCWTNNEGVKECGHKIPPEFAQKSHQELGSSGVVLEETERAKTIEELAEEERIAKLEAQETKKAEKQKNLDRILLQTFSNVDDIKRARDERFTALEAAIKLT